MELDWEKAEKHLDFCEEAYTKIGTAGYFVLISVVRPLRDRLNKGERTPGLFDEIMDVQT